MYVEVEEVEVEVEVERVKSDMRTRRRTTKE